MSEWISVKERLPMDGEMIWRFVPGKVIECVRLANPRDWLARWQPNWTHWMPAEIPAPPKSESDQAFDDWAKVHPVPPAHCVSRDYAKELFVAGFEKGRAAK